MERFLIHECRKTTTKVITKTNQSRGNQRQERIRIKPQNKQNCVKRGKTSEKNVRENAGESVAHDLCLTAGLTLRCVVT